MVTPISNLEPWMGGPYLTITARVTAKAEKKSKESYAWTGKYFSIKLDDGTGEIDMCFFDKYVDWYYNRIQVGKVYNIRGMRVKPRSPKSNTGVKHPCQLTYLTRNGCHMTSVREACGAIVKRIPAISIKIHKIRDICKIPLGTAVDTVGVVTKISSCENKVRRIVGGEEKYKMRVITIADPSGEITLALYGETAENFACEEKSGDVVAVIGAIVSDYGSNGARSLNSSHLTQIQVNPDNPIMQEYRRWYTSLQDNKALESKITRVVPVTECTRVLRKRKATTS